MQLLKIIGFDKSIVLANEQWYWPKKSRKHCSSENTPTSIKTQNWQLVRFGISSCSISRYRAPVKSFFILILYVLYLHKTFMYSVYLHQILLLFLTTEVCTVSVFLKNRHHLCCSSQLCVHSVMKITKLYLRHWIKIVSLTGEKVQITKHSCLICCISKRCYEGCSVPALLLAVTH